MGLDMYLRGEKFFWTEWDKPEGERRPMEDGFEVSEKYLALGYWRKHPNLHGFMVQTFANGEDNCEDIYLTKEDMEKVILAIREKNLPPTKGFFFGSSEDADGEADIKIFEKAIQWLETKEPNVSRSVFYRASW